MYSEWIISCSLALHAHHQPITTVNAQYYNEVRNKQF